MRIEHIENRDDYLKLEMWITSLAICMDSIKEHNTQLSIAEGRKVAVEQAIKTIVEKWQR